MRRGSLSERYVKCGKPGCGCAEDPKARHGPYYSLTRAVGGQTRSRFLNPEEAQRAREQKERGQQFRRQVDRYHVKEHLSQVAKALYGQGKSAHRWAQRRHQELDHGRWRSLTTALARQAARSPEARNCLQYLRRNRHRMRYAEFHAHYLCTSSGVLEAGCKVVVGSRLKRSGMHWTVRGSNAIIALRCYKLSGRFEDFWERRAHRVAA